MLTEHEKHLVLQNFPNFELCYEIMTHKKVHDASIMLAIPDGNKSFAWFTCYKNMNVCFLLEIDENHIKDVKIINTNFIDNLSLGLGTVFYGTLFRNNDVSYFCIEDIYYYSGKYYNNFTYLKKLETLRYIFTNELYQSGLENTYTIFGLPLMDNNFQLLLKYIQMLPYKISYIKYRFFNNVNTKKILTMKYFRPSSSTSTNSSIASSSSNIREKKNDIRKETVFKIMADIDPDIYNLFIYKNGIEEYYDIAFISDYTTSVMMNKLFRKIRENYNLDTIEESDDEEDFEDSREDKYVYLDRSFNMICEYNYKFKRWCPIRLAEKDDKIISSNLLYNILSKQK